MSLDAFPAPVDLTGFGFLDDLSPRRRKQLERGGTETTPFEAGDGLVTDWDTGQVFDRGDPNARGIDNMLDSDGTARQLEQVLTLPIRSADHALIGGSDRGRKRVEEVFPEPQRRQFIAQQTSGIPFRKAFFELDWRIDGKSVVLGQAPAFRPATACQQLFNRRTGAMDGFRKRVHNPGGMFDAQDWQRWYGPPMPGWIPVPRQRSHVYTHGTHRQPLKGITDLSVCWWAYETRKKLLWLWLRYCERAVAPIVGVYGKNPTEAQNNAEAMSRLKGGGYAPLVRPDEPSAKVFEVLEAATAAAGLFESCSRFLEGHMVDSVLAGFTKLSTGASAGGRGSQALGESDQQYFQKARQAVANEQAMQATTDVFAPICLYNGLSLADVPQMHIPLNGDHLSEAMTLVEKLITAPTVNAPDEFLDGLLMVVAPTLGLDADRLRDALEDYRAQQAEQRQQMQEQFEQAGMDTDDEGQPVDQDGNPQPIPPGQPGGPPQPPGAMGLRPRPGAPNARGADLANVTDAAWSLVRTAEVTGDPDGALDALTGRQRASRSHIDLATPKQQTGPTVAGVALMAADTGRVLMLQRGLDDDTDPAAGTWEFPGGHLEDDDQSDVHGAIREWAEEIGQPFPPGANHADQWDAPGGTYRGHVFVIGSEQALDLRAKRTVRNADDDYSEQAAWWDPDDAAGNPALRRECRRTPWAALKRAVRTRKSPTPKEQ